MTLSQLQVDLLSMKVVVIVWRYFCAPFEMPTRLEIFSSINNKQANECSANGGKSEARDSECVFFFLFPDRQSR